MLRRTAAEAELVNSSDKEGRTPIHLATGCFARAVREVDILLAAGADPWIADKEGNALLHTVFREGIWREKADGAPGEMWCDVLDRLLGLPGADARVNARNSAGETPVFGYFRRGKEYFNHFNERRREGTASEVERLYTEPAFDVFDAAGVDWGVVNNVGQTMLHLAAKTCMEKFAFLLAKGLDPMAEDGKHQTLLDVADAARARDILGLFENVGNNNNSSTPGETPQDGREAK